MFSGVKEILPPKPLPYAFSDGHVFEVAGEISGKLAAQLVKGQGKAICNSIEAPGGVAACQYTEGAAQAGGLQTGTVLFPLQSTADAGPGTPAPAKTSAWSGRCAAPAMTARS